MKENYLLLAVYVHMDGLNAEEFAKRIEYSKIQISRFKSNIDIEYMFVPSKTESKIEVLYPRYIVTETDKFIEEENKKIITTIEELKEIYKNFKI